jgi:predicted ATPase
VFVSSTLEDLVEERYAVRTAIEAMRLTPVMFEFGARSHPPRAIYQAYLAQSHVFVGIYGEHYGWVAPGQDISGLEDELHLGAHLPQLLYLKSSSAHIEPRLEAMLEDIKRSSNVTYRRFSSPEELSALVRDDLAVLLSERFVDSITLATTPGWPAIAVAPVPLTDTLGRDTELEQIAGLFRGGVRLLTITGPGGIGKSRFALELCRMLAPDFADGVVFVALEDVEEPGRVTSTIAHALGIEGDNDRLPIEALVERLTGQQVLMVLDNMEQVTAAGRDVAALLDRCPSVCALVTSRHVLRLRSEHAFPLAPLALPDAEAGNGDMTEVGSVALFIERARAVVPNFVPDREELAAIAEICRQLDGLPLAIELAAARTRLFPPAALLARMTRRLDSLGESAHDMPNRQRTMRATIEWSYRLLDPAERSLLARCAVFSGGASLGAVEAIGAGDPVDDPLRTLASLLDKSLLFTDTATGGATPRIRMLRTIREYADERLAESGEIDQRASLHARWYADLAEPADVLRHNDAVLHWPLLLAEQANLRTAAEWAIDQRDYPLIVDLARRLWAWLRSTGQIDELSVPIDQVLSDLPDDLAPAKIGALFTISAYITGLAGDVAKGIQLAERALVHLARAPDHPEGAVLTTAARLTLATLLTSRHAELDDVLTQFDEIVATSYQLNNVWLLANARSTRGLLRATMGDTAGARRDQEHALDSARTLHDAVLAAQATGLLAMVDVLDGRLDDGRERLRAHLEELQRSGSLERLANALDTAAALAVAEHRWDDAVLTTTTASNLRNRIHVAPWPLLRPYHDRSARIALANVGPRASVLVASVRSSDPWMIASRTLGNSSPGTPLSVADLRACEKQGLRACAPVWQGLYQHDRT